MENLHGACVLCGSDDRREKFVKRGASFVECSRCGVVSMWPLPSQRDLLAHYARMYDGGNYREYLENPEIRIQTFRRWWRVFLARSELRTGAVLDVGCAAGFFLDVASSDGWEVWGLDFAEAGASLAKQKYGGRIVLGELPHAAFRAGQFDLVALLDVLEHALNPVSMLREAACLVRQGGHVMITTPDTASIHARFAGKYWTSYIPTEHVHLFSCRNVLSLLEGAGLEIVARNRAFKILTLGYMHRMFRHFNPTLHRVLGPVVGILPLGIREFPVPVYGGEMFLLARKP